MSKKLQPKVRRLRKAKANKHSNQLRIIGGQWRGRKLDFADGEGLRPTMDRVRETVFNWLQGEIVDARCLDLFSGSGAMGLEALSRYAGEVVMIDKNPRAMAMIDKNLALLGAKNARVLQMDARDFLAQAATLEADKTYDIVFLDPPFNKQLVAPFCDLLAQSNCLSKQASIYIEMENNTMLPKLPEAWEVIRQKKAGQLAYYLVIAS